MEGQIEQALAHFEALNICRYGGYRTELAWCCFDYASIRHAQDDRERALALLDEANIIIAELGMRPLGEKVLDLKEQAAESPASAPTYPDGLT